MSKRHRLEQLLRNQRVWRAGQGGPRRQVRPTGFNDLDMALAGGWPVGRLVELLVGTYGIGELGLLMPALVGSAGKWVMLIAPPYLPYAPAFAEQGLDASRLLVVQCRRPADILWSAEQALHSHACAAVLAWCGSVDERSLRRLQLAAESDGACLMVLFRSLRYRRQRSPASLRIWLQSGADGALVLDVFKNHGGRPQTVTVRVGTGLPMTA